MEELSSEEAIVQSAAAGLLASEADKKPLPEKTKVEEDTPNDKVVETEKKSITCALVSSATKINQAEKQHTTSATLEAAAEAVEKSEEAHVDEGLAAAANAVVPKVEETLAALKESAANVEAQIATNLKEAAHDIDLAVEDGARRLEEVNEEDQVLEDAAARLQIEIDKDARFVQLDKEEKQKAQIPFPRRIKRRKNKKPAPKIDHEDEFKDDDAEVAKTRREQRKALSLKRHSMHEQNAKKEIERGAQLEARLLPKLKSLQHSEALVAAYHGDTHGVARAARRLGVQEGLGLRAALLTDQETGVSVAHVAALKGHARLLTELGRAWRREATDECDLGLMQLRKRLTQVANTLSQSTSKTPGKLRLALIRQEYEYCAKEADTLYRSLEQSVEASWRAVLTKRDVRGRSVLHYASACQDDGTTLQVLLSDQVRGRLSLRSPTLLVNGLRSLTDAQVTKLLREKDATSFFQETNVSKDAAPLFPPGIRFDAATGAILPKISSREKRIKNEPKTIVEKELPEKMAKWVKRDLLAGARRRQTRHGKSPRGSPRAQLLDAFEDRAGRSNTIRFQDFDATFRELGVVLAAGTMTQIARKYHDFNGQIDYKRLVGDTLESDNEAKSQDERPEIDHEEKNEDTTKVAVRNQDLMEARRAALNGQDEAGYTALHVLAYRSAPVEVIELVLKAGARRGMVSACGTLPEDLATKHCVKEALRKRILCELDKEFLRKKKQAEPNPRKRGFSADKMPGQYFDDTLGDGRFQLKKNSISRAKGALDAITAAALEVGDADTLRRCGTPGAPLLDDVAVDTHWRRVPQRKQRLGFDMNRYKMQFSKYFDPSAFPLDRKLGDGRLRSPLHLAAAAGLLDVVKKLLGTTEQSKPLFQVGAHDADGWTPLHHAAARGGDARREIVILLLKAKANPNARNLRGRTPLHLACASAINDQEDEEDVDMISALCRYSMTEILDETDDSGESALMIAAARGRVRIVAALLARGASAWYRHTKTRATALHMACVSRSTYAADAARLLAQWCSGGDGELVHYLTAANSATSNFDSSSTKFGHDREFPTQGFLSRSLDASSAEYKAEHTQRVVVAPAHALISSDEPESVTYDKVKFCTKLLDDADLRNQRLYATPLAAARDAKGDTPRDSARSKDQRDALDHLWAAALSGSLVRVKHAVQSRLNSREPTLYSLSTGQPWQPVSPYDLTPIAGRNALHLLALGVGRAVAAANLKSSKIATQKQAAASDFAACARHLLTTTRVDIDAEDFIARTPLHYAAASGCLPLIREFLNYGADVTIADDRGGFSALHFASAWCRHNVHSALLDAGASPGAQDRGGRTSRQVSGFRHKIEVRHYQKKAIQDVSTFLRQLRAKAARDGEYGSSSGSGDYDSDSHESDYTN